MNDGPHRLLKRQLRKVKADRDAVPTLAQWQALLDRVEQSYHQADSDRYTIERSLEISSVEMMELNARVAREHRRLDHLLGSLTEGVVQLDSEGRVAWSNAAAAQILQNDTINGSHFDDIALVRRGTHALRLEGLLEATGDGVDTHLILRGREVPVALTAAPLDAGQGHVLAIRDLTEIQRTRTQLWDAQRETEEARTAERAKTMFLANMSHELRTPLNAVIGYSEILIEDLADAGEPGWIEDLGRIESSGRHLLTLINDILDLSKIEAGRVELFRERVQVEPWVREIAHQVAPLIAKNNNVLEFDFGPYLGDGWFDQVRLRQCALNLLSNAAKFTKDGTITLRIRRMAEDLTITVQDTGIGMTPEQSVAVFEEFTQAEASTTRRFGGTGLGLTLTKKLVEIMDGFIELDSVVGEGSTFSLTIDVAPSIVGPRSQRFEPEANRSNGITVLVIDDDFAVHDMFGRHLSRDGYTVVTAGNGEEGVEIANALMPDVITLDVMMPELDGWSVLGQLREDPRTKDIPIVMVTMVDERQRGFSMGAHSYLSKPVSGPQLVETLERCGVVANQQQRVLVVDDDPLARRIMKLALSRSGYEVTEAGNGHEGLLSMEIEPPDAVLLDLMMPELDGFGFLREKRERTDLVDVPIFVLTAAALDDVERRYLDERVAQVLEKSPQSHAQVLNQLSAQLGRSTATANPAPQRITVPV